VLNVVRAPRRRCHSALLTVTANILSIHGVGVHLAGPQIGARRAPIKWPACARKPRSARAPIGAFEKKCRTFRSIRLTFPPLRGPNPEILCWARGFCPCSTLPYPDWARPAWLRPAFCCFGRPSRRRRTPLLCPTRWPDRCVHG